MSTDFAPHVSTGWDNPSRYYATASSIVNGTFPAWKAFNNATGNTDRWISGGACPQWLLIAVGAKQILSSYAITVSVETSRAPTAWQMQGSNDGTNWTTLDTQSGVTSWSDPETKTFTVTGNTTGFWMYRLYITGSNGSNPAVSELYLYTNSLNTVADVAPHNMTGMSSPSPYVVTESGHVSSFSGYFAFNDNGAGTTFDSWVSTPTSWIVLDIGAGTQKNIRGYMVWNVNATDSPTAWTLAGSNDGSSWVTIDTQSGVTWNNNGITDGIAKVVGLVNDSATFRYFKFTITAAAGSNAWLRELYLVPGGGLLSIEFGSPPSGTVGQPYSYDFPATAPDGSVFSISSGSLPPGVVLNTSTGHISGTPRATGSYTFTVHLAYGSPALTDSASGSITFGAPALTPGHGTIQVIIDGVDRTDSLHYGGGRIGWNLMRGNRGTCTLPFVVPPGSRFLPVIGQYVEIWDNGKREWAGTFESIAVGWLGDEGWHVSTATGVTLDSRIDGVMLNKEQVATLEAAPLTCGDAFTKLFNDADIPGLSLGTVEDGPNLTALNATNLKDAFDTIARIAGKVWYVDSRDLKVYFHDAGARDADWVLNDQETSAEGGVLWDSLQWSQSRTDFADKQVIQLPPQSMPARTSTFDGDGATTVFTFPDGVYPQYVLSAKNSGLGDTINHDIQWTPGTNQISISPPMEAGQSLVVKWYDEGQVIVDNLDFGSFVGHKARRYTRTRTFTADGTLQEATAMLARYAMLPSQCQLTTDKPGITIARKWQIDIDSPAEAGGLVNGYWQVVEVEAEVVPGLEQLGDPYGHFRYTLHLVNFYATAIYVGDGTTTNFALPQPGAVQNTTVWNAPGTYGSIALPNYTSVTPAPPDGATVVTQYTPSGANTGSPDVQPFTDAWQQMFPDSGLDPLTGYADSTLPEIPATFLEKKIGIRTLTLRDTTVGDDIAPTTEAYHAGAGKRLLAVLSTAIADDLVVRINFNTSGQNITITIPSSTVIRAVLEFPLETGSPPLPINIEDQEVMTADILSSSGEKNILKGVAQITVQWEWD